MPPIHKKGAKNEKENYMPISLTSIVCRIVEKIIKEGIVDYDFLRTNCFCQISMELDSSDPVYYNYFKCYRTGHHISTQVIKSTLFISISRGHLTLCHTSYY